MIGTTASTTAFVSTPTVHLLPAAEQMPQVNLFHVAYFRDNTSYEDLLRALLQKVSVMQKHLAAETNR